MICRRDSKTGKFTKLQQALMGGAPTLEKRPTLKDSTKRRMGEAAEERRAARSETIRRRRGYAAGSGDTSIAGHAGDWVGKDGLAPTEEQKQRLKSLNVPLSQQTAYRW